MKITVIGCGNAWSRLLGNTSFLVEHKSVKLVVDCGFNVPERLEKIVPLDSITHYFISHIHADHVGGLEEVAFKSYFLHKRKPYLLFGQAFHPHLWVNCLSGGLRNLLTPDGKQDMIASLHTYFEVFTLPVKQWVRLGSSGLLVAIYQTKHVGLKLNSSLLVVEEGETKENKEKKVLFTCDVVVRQALPYSAADLIFHDCSFKSSYPASVHCHLEDLLKVPEEVQKKIVCVHYEDSVVEERPIRDLDIEPLRLASPFESYQI